MSSHLSTKYRQQVTWNGHKADIMKSGLQKYIRRGVIDKALFCAGELDLFKESPEKDQGEGIRTNFLHRLIVIFMEDVENMSIFEDVYKTMKALFQERVKPDRNTVREEHLISEVVIQMGLSTKARVCSHIRAVFNPKYKPIHAKYPTITALWEEIEKNQQESKGDHLEFLCSMFKKYLVAKNPLAVYYGFQIEQSEQKLKEKLFRSYKPVWFIFQQLLSPLSPSKSERVNRFVEWYKDHIGDMNEGFMCWLLPLLCELGVVPEGEKPHFNKEDYPNSWERNRNGEMFIPDEYVLDKHTSKGRGKGLIEFAMEGAKVENQAPFVRPLWKKFYEDGKFFEEAGLEAVKGEVPSPSAIKSKKPVMKAFPVANQVEEYKDGELESKAFTFLVRTQITTMGSKMDVYLAKDASGKVVVVKGPYASRSEINILLSNTEWKKKHNLPYNAFEVRRMIPDRWPEGVPLGARNMVDRNQPSNFLVFESYIKEEDIRTKMHSSKAWPETEVVDWDKIPFHFDYKKRPLTEQEYIDYIHEVLFRYLLGISDYADRNFVMKDGRVISIDEDVENKPVNIYDVLKKNKADFLYHWLKDNYEKLDVASWTPKNPENKEQQQKLEEIQNRAACLRLFQAPGVSVEPSVQPKAPEPKAPELKAPEPRELAPKALEPALKPSAPVSVRDTIKPEISISTMNDNFVFIDNLYRSRMTLLDILAERGYDVERYRKFSPAEATIAADFLPSLSFTATKTANPAQVCEVRYTTSSRPKPDMFNDIPDEKSESTEVVVMMENLVADIHHQTALKEYMKWKEQKEDEQKTRRKLRVSFFSIHTLVVNPMRHVLVPKHEIVPDKEDAHKKLMESMYITSKSKFPEIKFHVDPIARCIGAVPGDIVKITRPSASSGQAIIYRVCAP
jgi:DNA-directed RNA polymerase subunit H